MSYTCEDAEDEVGNSVDWEVGRGPSMKKWQQIIQFIEAKRVPDFTIDAKTKLPYSIFKECGFCFVAWNRSKPTKLREDWSVVCPGCPAGKICRAMPGIVGLDDARGILQDLEELDLKGE